jgi:hypothetical protein
MRGVVAADMRERIYSVCCRHFVPTLDLSFPRRESGTTGLLFVWLISHQPAVLFSQNKLATSNQPTVLFSQNKPAVSHQPNEQADFSLITNQHQPPQQGNDTAL